MTERQYTPADAIIVVTTETVHRLPHEILGPVVGVGRASGPAGAVEHALVDLRRSAEKVRADAVVAVQHTLAHDPADGLGWRATVLGTAVVLPWPRGHGDPSALLADPDR